MIEGSHRHHSVLPDGRSRRSALGAAVGVGLAAGVLSVVVYVSVTREIAFGIFTGDSRRAVVDDWYAGLLSDIGVVIWTLGAVASLTAALVHARRRGPDTAFFAGMGAITAWLAADDAYLWHEELLPDAFGIKENVVVATYGLAAVAAAVAGRRSIARNLWWVFAAAGALLAGSLVAEQIGFSIGSPAAMVGVLKFLGIAMWTAFFVEAAIHRIRRPAGGGPFTRSATWSPPRREDAVGGQNLSG